MENYTNVSFLGESGGDVHDVTGDIVRDWEDKIWTCKEWVGTIEFKF